MTRTLTQAEIDLCDQFEAFMASLIEGPVKHFTVTRTGSWSSAYGYDGETCRHGLGETLSLQVQHALGEAYTADADKANILKAKITAMQAQLDGLAA